MKTATISSELQRLQQLQQQLHRQRLHLQRLHLQRLQHVQGYICSNPS